MNAVYLCSSYKSIFSFNVCLFDYHWWHEHILSCCHFKTNAQTQYNDRHDNTSVFLLNCLLHVTDCVNEDYRFFSPYIGLLYYTLITVDILTLPKWWFSVWSHESSLLVCIKLFIESDGGCSSQCRKACTSQLTFDWFIHAESFRLLHWTFHLFFFIKSVICHFP